jgi:Zn-dependent peptidase ImmA (M78 family)/transcriptional regulator with XRE-family HTH domain
MIGTPGFVGQRLIQARQARELSSTSLAEMIGLNSVNISNYEHGKQSPSPEVMERITQVLNQPLTFFLRPLPRGNREEDFWWRAMSAATKSARSRAYARHSWLREIVLYLQEYVDFPNVNIPVLDAPADVRKITSDMIEDFAAECRRYWKLGDAPVADLVLLMENNGVVVSRGELVAETLDAFSQWPGDSEHPFVFLGADKASAARSRHDASHELGHLVLHRKVDRKNIRNPTIFKLIEDQAHRFALAFNLPASGFANQLWSPTLDAFLALKPHWKIAIAAMIKRCEQLGILSEEQARRSWIDMSRRGWRKREPLDDRLPPEQPRLLRRSFELLIRERIKSPEQILSDLALNAVDIEALACLDYGYLSGEGGQLMAVPQLRQEFRGGSANLLPFESKKNSKTRNRRRLNHEGTLASTHERDGRLENARIYTFL